MTSRMKYSGVIAERNVMNFSVVRENCSTSPVFSSVFDRQIERMKPPNSAERTSSGTPPSLTVSTAMPSSPMRLTASAPVTCFLIPASTSLNTFHPGQPVLQLLDLRIGAPRCGAGDLAGGRRRDRRRHTRRPTERVDLCADAGVVRFASEKVFVD